MNKQEFNALEVGDVIEIIDVIEGTSHLVQRPAAGTRFVVVDKEPEPRDDGLHIPFIVRTSLAVVNPRAALGIRCYLPLRSLKLAEDQGQTNHDS